MAAGILGASVELDQPFAEAGLDSIGSVEFRNAASALAEVDLPATIAFDYPTVSALAQYICGLTLPLAFVQEFTDASRTDHQGTERVKQVSNIGTIDCL